MSDTTIDPSALWGIEYKSVETQARASETHDLGDGIIEAIVSITNMQDNVKDVILPGAYEKSLQDRTPKGVWHHSWTDPIAKTHEIKELRPGDPLLPDTLPDGSPWPSNAGALYVKMEFNLNTDKGRNAYEDVRFFGDSQEWSIGYKVPEKKSYRKGGVRYIEALDLYEYSPVLFGAMPNARTATVKDAQLAYKSLMGDDTDEFIGEESKAMSNEERIIELKSALSDFADQFYDLVEKIGGLTEEKSDTPSDRDAVLEAAESLDLDPEDFEEFHEYVDEEDTENAEAKALAIMDLMEEKSGDDASFIVESLGLELKSVSRHSDDDDDDDDEPDDESEEDEDWDDEEEDDEEKSFDPGVEIKSVPMDEFARYV